MIQYTGVLKDGTCFEFERDKSYKIVHHKKIMCL
jgi:hypothetical protein